jgi:hypothetical protein
VAADRVAAVQRQTGPDQAGGAVADLHQVLLAQAAQQFGQQERLPAYLGQRGHQGRVRRPPEQLGGEPGHRGLVQRAKRDRDRVGRLQP